MDQLLQKDPYAEDFHMFLQKKDNMLLIKREGDKPSSIVGHEFEKVLCDGPYEFASCHVVVECLVTAFDMPPIRILVRGEIDAQLPVEKTRTQKEYGKKTKVTSTGLKVYSNSDFPPLSMDCVREIKMAKELNDLHFFQAWLLGVPAFVHGMQKRSETKTKNMKVFNERFAAVLDKFMACRARMEDNKIESEHPRQWLNMDKGEKTNTPPATGETSGNNTTTTTV